VGLIISSVTFAGGCAAGGSAEPEKPIAGTTGLSRVMGPQQRAVAPAADVDAPYAPAAGLRTIEFDGQQFAPGQLVGQTVRDRAYNPIGQLTDLVKDDQGEIVLALIEMDGQRTAAPWSAVYVQPRPLRIVVDAPRQQLEALAFRPGDEPYLTDTSYVQRVFREFADDVAPVYAYAEGDMEPVNKQPRLDSMWYSSLSAADDALEPPPSVLIEGEIIAKREFRTDSSDIGGSTELLVRTDDEKTWTVLIQSNDALRRQEAELKVGERINALGAHYRQDKRDLLIASNIINGEQMIRLPAASKAGLEAYGGPIRQVGPTDAFPHDNPAITPGSLSLPGRPLPEIPLLPNGSR
jgi:hypothetical protein